MYMKYMDVWMYYGGWMDVGYGCMNVRMDGWYVCSVDRTHHAHIICTQAMHTLAHIICTQAMHTSSAHVYSPSVVNDSRRAS